MNSNEENGEQSERAGGALTEIAGWLEELGLGRYASTFLENDIDFAVLPNLSDADLRELGIGSLGHRKRLLVAIEGRSGAPRQGMVERVVAPLGERR
jgi:SAM domain (Sterile alpha motif)